MKHAVVRFVDPERSRIFSKRFVVGTAGRVYEENENYLVLYSSWEDEEEFSWSSKFDFVVIPKKYVEIDEIQYW